MTLQQALDRKKAESTQERVRELVEILRPAPYRYRGAKPEPSGPGLKVCGTCWEEKPLSEFQAQASSKDGRRPNCPKCNSQSAIKSTKRRQARSELMGLVETGVITREKYPDFPWELVQSDSGS